jgi:hypothetical protein
MVIMYVIRASMTPKIIGKVQTAVEWFSGLQDELVEVDVSCNPELENQLVSETGGRDFPLFYEDHVRPIGSLESLEAWIHTRKASHNSELDQVVGSFEDLGGSGPSGPSPSGDLLQVSPGYLGSALNSLEWIARGTSSWFLPSVSSQSSEGERSPRVLGEFSVIQTNWYWRGKRNPPFSTRS